MGQPGRGTGRLTSIGPYTLLDRVGAGGMGVVYRALDRRSGTVVAFKLLHDHVAADPGAVERFRREAHVASLLRSSYAVHTLDFGSEDGKYYLVSEFIDGRSLAEILREGRPDPLAAIAIVSQAALALDEAESRQVTHRDIKPDNILITDDGAARLGDFGIASLSYLGGLTQAGAYIGTVAYSAPEQHRGEADIRSDIYSLGVVLYEMLAGRRPFQSDSPTGLMRMHEEAPVPMEPIAHLPEDLREVVRRCLEKDPAKRYQHPSELLAALNACRKAVAAGAPLSESWMERAVADMAATAAFVVAADAPEGPAGSGSSAVPAASAAAPAATRADAAPQSSVPATRIDSPSEASSAPPAAPAATEIFPSNGSSPVPEVAATRIEPQPLVGAAEGGRKPPRRTLLMALGGGAVLLIAAVGAFLALSGGGGGSAEGDDDEDSGLSRSERRTATAQAIAEKTPSPSPTGAASATASASASASASAVPSGIATFEANTPAPTATRGNVVPPPTNTPRPPTPTPVPPTPVPPTPTPAPVFKVPLFAPGPVTASGDPPGNAVFSGSTLSCNIDELIVYVVYSNVPVGTVFVGNWYYEGQWTGSNPPFSVTLSSDTTWYQYFPGDPGTYGFFLEANGVIVSQGEVDLVC